MNSPSLLAGYVLLLFGSLPLAWPLWTGFLRDRIGGVISVEEFHLIEYGVLGILTWRVLQTGGPRAMRWLPCLGATFSVGLAEELLQALLPQRFFQWSDVGLNWAGTAAGLAAGWLVQGTVRRLAGRGAPCRTR